MNESQAIQNAMTKLKRIFPRAMRVPLGMLLATLAMAWVAPDALEFHGILSSKYQTPWYSTNWIKSPYTNWALLGKPSRDYWKDNAVGSEHWLVREVTYEDKTFWTILDRISATESRPN